MEELKKTLMIFKYSEAYKLVLYSLDVNHSRFSMTFNIPVSMTFNIQVSKVFKFQ